MQKIRCYIVIWLMLVPTLVLADVGTLYDKADSLYNAQLYDAAQQQALEALTQCKDSADVADCASLLALIYVRQGHFEQAALYAKRCNAIDLKTGDPDNIASSFNTLAGIYMSMRQPEEAEKYILKAINYSQKTDNQQRQAVLLGMASEVYHKLNQEERSLDYATKAYEMEKRLGRKDKMVIRQAQRAASLISLQRNSDAKKALSEAIPGLRESHNDHSLGIASNQMGLLLHQEHNDTAAARYFSEALEIFLSQHDLYNEAQSRKGLYETLRHTDPDLAMEHNDRYLALRDSIYDKDTGELLSRYAAEYGNNELQAENAQMQLDRRLYIIIGVTVFAILLMVIAAVSWYSGRRQHRIEQLIAQITQLKSETEKPEVLAEPESVVEPKPIVESSPSDTEDHLFLMRLVKTVNDSLPTGNYSVNDIASKLNMSEQTFRRRLAKVTGESPKSFISAIQMELAAKLLADSPDMTISEIATRCGYGDNTSFGRVFRKTYGASPTQFREHHS